MGTRHNITVIIDGQKKVCQYGQWDGYPTGEGNGIANFLKSMNKEVFCRNLRNVTSLTEQDIEEINKNKNWKQDFPWLSRDAGSDVLSFIESGDCSKILYDDDMFCCQYLYTINMDNETVKVNDHDPVPFSDWTPELMEELEKKEREY